MCPASCGAVWCSHSHSPCMDSRFHFMRVRGRLKAEGACSLPSSAEVKILVPNAEARRLDWLATAQPHVPVCKIAWICTPRSSCLSCRNRTLGVTGFLNSPWVEFECRPRHISNSVHGQVRLWQGMQRGTSELASEMHQVQSSLSRRCINLLAAASAQRHKKAEVRSLQA